MLTIEQRAFRGKAGGAAMILTEIAGAARKNDW